MSAKRSPLHYLFDREDDWILLTNELFSGKANIETTGWILTNPEDFKNRFSGKIAPTRAFEAYKQVGYVKDIYSSFGPHSILLKVNGIMLIKKEFKELAEIDTVGNKWLNVKYASNTFSELFKRIKNELIARSLWTPNRIKDYVSKTSIKIRENVIEKAIEDIDFFKKYILDPDYDSFLDSLDFDKAEAVVDKFIEKQNKLLHRKDYFEKLCSNVTDKKLYLRKIDIETIYMPKRTVEEFRALMPIRKFSILEPKDIKDLEKFY